jgi:hypothetical protein
MKLFDKVTGWMYSDAKKHGLGEEYVERVINEMSNFEFLEAISEALFEMEDFKDES